MIKLGRAGVAAALWLAGAVPASASLQGVGSEASVGVNGTPAVPTKGEDGLLVVGDGGTTP